MNCVLQETVIKFMNLFKVEFNHLRSEKGNDKWLKSNFQLEIVELDDFSETLQKLLNIDIES